MAILFALASCGGRGQKKTEVTDTTDSVELNFSHSDGVYRMNDLGRACHDGDLETLQKLVAGGHSLEDCMTDDIFEYDALYVAVHFGRKNIVEYLIGLNGLDKQRFYDENCKTLLNVAVRIGMVDLAEVLLKAGANPNGADKCGGDVRYPLVEAAADGNMAMAKMLILWGADTKVLEKASNPVSTAILDSMYRVYHEQMVVDGIKNFDIHRRSDTIVQDMNSDGVAERIFFNDSRNIVIVDGDTNTERIFIAYDDDDGEDSGNNDNWRVFDWVDFWGVTNDSLSYCMEFTADETLVTKEVQLLYPSIFVRKLDSGGGIITFDGEQFDGKYVWIHQND
jgi:hypothetical protein